MIKRTKEWWLALLADEPDCPITAGVPDDRDALFMCQQFAALGIEQTNDTGPLADLFAAIHRTAAGALQSKAAPRDSGSRPEGRDSVAGSGRSPAERPRSGIAQPLPPSGYSP